ncbi:GntR family transcriptional regulator, transcriptional repressor for pyruvate dehydrogenase complex [Devosia enhydra]|uniref:GntR family transcriptional regulator, transcriptional repressor for pyruvate dehydrogenase complex n=1 Tax=Devosia enhydra TaxID=665118 RepID=A0A1K2HW92_9HYPH|nr:FadR/GntR family transcriptional regulator [Devosia enhydra]SFZ83231.1 GntR family transcriptional regulator, transcriptional repressor for pyruvate dehydrogenase complex [Devosia enhydra]
MTNDTSDATRPGASGTAAASVADALSAMILDELRPGERLPAEADLAQRFSVSRLTVREAVKMLAGRGMLDLGRGRRAVVRQPDGSAFTDFLTALLRNDPRGLFDLIELRIGLEVQSATLAARRCSRAGIVALEGALRGMREIHEAERDGLDPAEAERRFNAYDLGFHEALAAAGGNRVLSYLFEAMAQPLLHSFHLSRRGQDVRGHSPADVIAAHEAVLQAVREGNPRAAAEAMRAHLEETEQDIRTALEARLPVQRPRSEAGEA